MAVANTVALIPPGMELTMYRFYIQCQWQLACAHRACRLVCVLVGLAAAWLIYWVSTIDVAYLKGTHDLSVEHVLHDLPGAL
jgi:hypothetical protein